MGIGSNALGSSFDHLWTDKERLGFDLETLKKDAIAGTITGLMAIPLSVGICLMSNYPIQIGLLTVIVACIVSFIFYFIRPGNHIGVPGIAAGLAPVLAMSIHKFGMPLMPWIIFLTSVMQFFVWRYKLEAYILKIVPHYLIEGLLAGVGLKIAMKFFPYTYEGGTASTSEQLQLIFFSLVALFLFLKLYKTFKETNPGYAYIIVIAGSVLASRFISFPMLHLEPYRFSVRAPFPDFKAIALKTHIEMILFAVMLSLIDIIEQVMSNAAISNLDPLKRPSNSNNSLLVIWIANMIASFFGGMTNLDGLAKSSTNRMAGARTKTSNLFVAAVFGIVLIYPALLTSLPEFALAVLMIFTGWKMIAGLFDVAEDGEYAFGLALFCGLLVFKLGIFEGLLISLCVHSFITFVIFRHDAIPVLEILRRFIRVFSDSSHPHATATLGVHLDSDTGAYRYCSVESPSKQTKRLDDFINDWALGVNHRNLLCVVSTYDAAGLLWGTFAKDLKTGHFKIKQYFEHLFLFDGLKVNFDSAETRQYNDIYIRSGSYTFSYIKKGSLVSIPARYSFVCKKEKTGWYILEHHSSEFPA